MLKEKFLVKLNTLPAEVKISVARGLSLIEKTEDLMHKKWGDYDMSAQFALKDGIKELERTMKELSKGKVTEKLTSKLDLDIIKLKTLSENILHWTFEE